MHGTTYLLAGQPVTVTTPYNARTRDLPAPPPFLHWRTPPRGVPRNVAIRHTDGRTVVRPFRGLRVPPGGSRA